MGLAVASVFWSYSGKSVKGKNPPAFTELAGTVCESLTQPSGQCEFPLVLRDTGLIAEYLAEYEGPFLEDDIQEPVSGVAALMVYNPGQQYVESVQIVLRLEESILQFQLTHLPPHSRVLVIEEGGKTFTKEPVLEYFWNSLKLLDHLNCEGICVEENEEQLTISNFSEQDHSAVKLYYKQYSQEGDFYIGGKTCSYSIGILSSGETLELLPYRYAPGYSRLIAVVCEKEQCASVLDAHCLFH